MNRKILFINRRKKNCGVIDYGIRLFNIIKKSLEFDVIFVEVENESEILSNFFTHSPDLIIYNYYESVLPFVTNHLVNNLSKIPHVVIYHESGLSINPNGVLVVDSTQENDEKRNLFSLPRPLFEDIEFPNVKNEIPVIGSFGFGFRDKNFPLIAEMVCKQFNKAKIRLNVPFATFGDADGSISKNEIEKVKKTINNLNKNIELEYSHDFLEHEDILKFLSENDINVFLYDKHESRSLSSTIDYALSVKKPIGISDSHMFRHINWVSPSIVLYNTTIPNIINNGIEALNPLYLLNSNKSLINKFNYSINKILNNYGKNR